MSRIAGTMMGGVNNPFLAASGLLPLFPEPVAPLEQMAARPTSAFRDALLASGDMYSASDARPTLETLPADAEKSSEDDSSIVGSIVSAPLTGLEMLGSVLDVLGGPVRTTLANLAGTAPARKRGLGAILRSIVDPSYRVTGQELLGLRSIPGHYGKNLGNAAVAFLAEAGLDPLTYATFFAAPVAGKIAKMSGGLAKYARMPANIGKGGLRLRATSTLRDVLQHAPETREAAKIAARKLGTTLEQHLDEPLAAMVGFGFPFRSVHVPVTGKFGSLNVKAAENFGKFLEKLRYGTIPGTKFSPGQVLASLFNADVAGTYGKTAQMAAKAIQDASEVGRILGSQDAAEILEAWSRHGEGMTSEELADIVEGVKEPPEWLAGPLQRYREKLSHMVPAMAQRGKAAGTFWTGRHLYAPRMLNPEVPLEHAHVPIAEKGEQFQRALKTDDPHHQRRHKVLRWFTMREVQNAIKTIDAAQRGAVERYLTENAKLIPDPHAPAGSGKMLAPDEYIDVNPITRRPVVRSDRIQNIVQYLVRQPGEHLASLPEFVGFSPEELADFSPSRMRELHDLGANFKNIGHAMKQAEDEALREWAKESHATLPWVTMEPMTGRPATLHDTMLEFTDRLNALKNYLRVLSPAVRAKGMYAHPLTSLVNRPIRHESKLHAVDALLDMLLPQVVGESGKTAEALKSATQVAQAAAGAPSQSKQGFGKWMAEMGRLLMPDKSGVRGATGAWADPGAFDEPPITVMEAVKRLRFRPVHVRGSALNALKKFMPGHTDADLQVLFPNVFSSVKALALRRAAQYLGIGPLENMTDAVIYKNVRDALVKELGLRSPAAFQNVPDDKLVNAFVRYKAIKEKIGQDPNYVELIRKAFVDEASGAKLKAEEKASKTGKAASRARRYPIEKYYEHVQKAARGELKASEVYGTTEKPGEAFLSPAEALELVDRRWNSVNKPRELRTPISGKLAEELAATEQTPEMIAMEKEALERGEVQENHGFNQQLFHIVNKSSRSAWNVLYQKALALSKNAKLDSETRSTMSRLASAFRSSDPTVRQNAFAELVNLRNKTEQFLSEARDAISEYAERARVDASRPAQEAVGSSEQAAAAQAAKTSRKARKATDDKAAEAVSGKLPPEMAKSIQYIKKDLLPKVENRKLAGHIERLLKEIKSHNKESLSQAIAKIIGSSAYHSESDELRDLLSDEFMSILNGMDDATPRAPAKSVSAEASPTKHAAEQPRLSFTPKPKIDEKALAAASRLARELDKMKLNQKVAIQKINQLFGETKLPLVNRETTKTIKRGILHDPNLGGAIPELLRRQGMPITKESLASEANRLLPASYVKQLAKTAESFRVPNAVSMLGKLFDSYTSLFKTSVLSRPSRHVRDLISNIMSSVLAGHVPVHRVYRAYMDAAKLVHGKPIANLQEIPEVVERLMQLGLEPTDAGLTRALGHILAEHEAIARYGGELGALRPAAPGSPEELLMAIPGTIPFSWYGLWRKLKGKLGTSWNPMKWRVRGVHGPLGVAETTTVPPFAVSEDLNFLTDAIGRAGPAIELMRRGFTSDEAMKLVRQAQVDYRSRAYTEFERALARLFPFYRFSKGAASHVFSELAHKPGGSIGRLVRASNVAREANTDDNMPLPDYLANTLAIPLPSGESGAPRYLTGLGLMHEDPIQFLGGGLKGATLEAMSRLNPLIKFFLELGTGQTFFQRGPAGGRALEDLDPTVGRIIANLTGGTEPGERASPFISMGVEHVLANSPLTAYLSTLRMVTDRRKGLLNRLLNTLTGIRTTDVSQAAQDAILREQLQGFIHGLPGSTEFKTVTVPKDRLDKLTPSQQQMYAEAAAAIKELNARAKARREALKASAAQ